MGKKRTAPWVFSQKGSSRIVCVTAYDVMSAQMADLAEVDVVLVGDSLGNVILGQNTTVQVTLEEVAHHIKAVKNGLQNALLVGDLPFGTYNSSTAQAVDSAVALMKAGAEAIKLEGDYPEAVEAFVRAGIPTMGHVGFTPQSVNVFGGFRVQGRGEDGDEVIKTAQRLADAGAFAIVLELVPADLARRITEAVACPTIGIGAGIDCDGEIQVWHDILGLSEHKFKHARAFVEGREMFVDALTRYRDDVKARRFPTEENSF